MDLAEIGRLIGASSDRVIMILVFVGAVRYLASRNEEQRKQLVSLYERAEKLQVQMVEVVTMCTAVLERVEKKLD